MWVWSVYFVLQDKTFGLKNKKGKRQQQLIKQVTNQVKYGGQSIQKVILVNDLQPIRFLDSNHMRVYLTMLLFMNSQRESADFQAKVSLVHKQLHICYIMQGFSHCPVLKYTAVCTAKVSLVHKQLYMYVASYRALAMSSFKIQSAQQRRG